MAVPTRLGCVFARGLRQLSARDEALLERASRVAPGWTALLDAAKAIPPRESRSVRIAGRRSSIEVIGERKIVHAVGRRKEAVAQVWLEAAKGDALASIVVNNKLCTEYFPWPLSSVAVSPFLLTGTSCNYGAKVVVRGGGMSGQAQAVRHGIATALQELDAHARLPMKRADMLTRDPRVVERKKPGKPKARKSSAWVKR
ncbi:hypothetical protein KFE25_010036 [Diacronema lutheri]|uniref:30S ribosomal protein S9, chloroplastic n=2 Tax=Diacronema lutheri TaxID=2081491 RepID=A0A8J5XHZ1_DIALT|nr:hypothetical protein KFE25_010036 [Diacronema lutheri]